jgi:transposase-like protein
MQRCPYCQRTEGQVKNGQNRSGSQRWQCKHCQRKYTPEPHEAGYDESVRQRAVQMYVDGMNLRRIARTLGVVHQTAANWVNAQADQLPDSPPTPPEPLQVNELDELYTFIGDKKTKSTSSRR